MITANILFNNKFFLKFLCQTLDEIGDKIEVCYSSENFDNYVDNAKKSNPGLLIMDLNSMDGKRSGIDIAGLFPNSTILFVNACSISDFKMIEDIRIENQCSVETLSKPLTSAKLIPVLLKLIDNIELRQSENFIPLDLRSYPDTVYINQKDIVFLKAKGRDKEIFFTNRKRETLLNFSFKKMETRQFPGSVFIPIHQSYRINIHNIYKIDTVKHQIVVRAFKDKKPMQTMQLPISDNYYHKVYNLWKKSSK